MAQLYIPARAGRLVLLVPAGVLAVVFLLQDYVSPSTGPALLVDVLCFILSFIVLVGGVCAPFAPTAIGPRLFVAASSAAVLLSLAVLATACSPQQKEPLVIPGAVLVLVTALINLKTLGATPSWFHASLGASISSVLALVAIPLFSFWQASAFLPSQSEVSLTTQISGIPVTTEGGSQHWQITGTSKNPSPVRAYIVVSNMIACSWSNELERATSSTDPRQNPSCIPLTRPIERGWIDAGGQLDFSDSVPVIEGKEFLTLHFRVAYGRGDRLRDVQGSDRPASPAEAGSCLGARLNELREQSRLRSFVLQPKFLMFADADGDGGLNYFVAARDDLVCPIAPDKNLAEYYSITQARVVWTGWLAESTAPPSTPADS